MPNSNSTPSLPISRRNLLSTASIALGALAVAQPGLLLAQTVPTNEALDAKYFPGFKVMKQETNGATIHTVVGGSGPAVLLIHGAPFSHLAWSEIAVNLAKNFTVVATDLRGYGWSSKLDGGADHINYSKRNMALDQSNIMQSLGLNDYHVVGHDRGGRVARRLTLDNPKRVKSLTVLDIAPEHYLYSHVTREFVEAYFHWFLFLRPSPVPENFVTSTNQYITGGPGELGEAFTRVYKDPAAIHAMIEDYRASAGMDLKIDEADLKAGKKIECPLNVLWGDAAPMGKLYDLLAIWKQEATKVEGKAMPGGHNFLMDNPGPTYAELKRFFG